MKNCVLFFLRYLLDILDIFWMSVFHPGMKQEVSRCTKKSLWPGYSQASDGSKLEAGVSALQAMFTPVVVFRKYQTTLLNPPSSPCFSCNQCAQWRPCQDSGAVSPCNSPSNVPVTARPASGRMMLTASRALSCLSPQLLTCSVACVISQATEVYAVFQFTF